MADLHGESGSSQPAGPEPRLTEKAWTFILTGVVLLIATLSTVYLGTSRSPARSSTSATSLQLTPEMVPLVTGDEPLPKLFHRAGCAVCHTIPGIQGATGRVGPKLVLGTTGAQRLADPGYKGQATTVREYIVESILNPGAYVVPGYPERAMPRWYGQKLSASALDKIAAYLESLMEDATDQPP